jgi:hypothetical protein
MKLNISAVIPSRYHLKQIPNLLIFIRKHLQGHVPFVARVGEQSLIFKGLIEILWREFGKIESQ